MGNDPTSCDNTILIAALRDIQDGYSYFNIFTSQKARYKIEQNAYCLLAHVLHIVQASANNIV